MARARENNNLLQMHIVHSMANSKKTFCLHGFEKDSSSLTSRSCQVLWLLASKFHSNSSAALHSLVLWHLMWIQLEEVQLLSPSNRCLEDERPTMPRLICILRAATCGKNVTVANNGYKSILTLTCYDTCRSWSWSRLTRISSMVVIYISVYLEACIIK